MHALYYAKYNLLEYSIAFMYVLIVSVIPLRQLLVISISVIL